MTHPAILKAQELDDDRSRDLEPNEQALIAVVNQIADRKVQSYKAAQSIWGDVPKMYRSWLIAADEVANFNLDRALSTYNDSLEYKFDEAMAAISEVLAAHQQAAE